MTRAERRDQWDKAKRRAARVWRRWHPRRGNEPDLVKGWSSEGGVRVYSVYTAREIAADIAHLAETHCRACSCWSCASHKDVPPRRERSAFADEKDWRLEMAQEQAAEEARYLSMLNEECDEMAAAFGHDGHRSMLMTSGQLAQLSM